MILKEIYKSYFIIRADLGLPEAKLAVQVGHGVDMIWLNKGVDDNAVNVWLTKDGGDRRKIMLKTKSLEQLNNIKAELELDGLHCFDIVDSGYTEVEPNTLTGIVIFPTAVVHKKLNRLRSY